MSHARSLTPLEKTVVLAAVAAVDDQDTREKLLQRWTARLLQSDGGGRHGAGDKRRRQQDGASEEAGQPPLATCRFASLVKRGDHWELKMQDVLISTPEGATSFKRLEGLLFVS